MDIAGIIAVFLKPHPASKFLFIGQVLNNWYKIRLQYYCMWPYFLFTTPQSFNKTLVHGNWRMGWVSCLGFRENLHFACVLSPGRRTSIGITLHGQESNLPDGWDRRNEFRVFWVLLFFLRTFLPAPSCSKLRKSQARWWLLISESAWVGRTRGIQEEIMNKCIGCGCKDPFSNQLY